jgi:hypothetical protein
MRLGKVSGERASPGHRFLPPRSTLFGPDLDPLDQVGFAEHTNQVARVVENGKSTDVVLR